MKTLVKQTKTKTYLNFNGEIYKTSNQHADRSFEIVDFSNIQKDQADAINSPHNWQEVGDFNTLEAAYDQVIKLQLEKQAARKAEKEKFNAECAQRATAEWNAIKDLSVIPTTIDNLRIVMQHLNTQNWGSWTLPRMDIGYSAHQYDCDGVQATAVKLDSPISDDDYPFENETMFKVGGKRGYLQKYRSL